jgi:hypothetical protein
MHCAARPALIIAPTTSLVCTQRADRA